MTILFIIGFLLISLVVIYKKPRLWLWSLVILAYFIGAYPHVGITINAFAYYLLALIFAAGSIVTNVSLLRRMVSRLIYAKAKTILPSISETERLALNAGDPWWEKDVFQGAPDYHKLHDLKKFELSLEEQEFLHNETNQLCAMIDDWNVNNSEKDLPVSVWNFIRDKGFLGLVIKKEYGGKGFSAAAHSEVVMKLATRSGSAAVTVMVPNSLGPGELLEHYGTDQQKQYYLPRLAKGQEIPCFALTGPTAGSDATSIPDEGIVCMGEYNGQTVLGIRLQNVNKRYITLAPIATLVGLAFQLKDPDNLLQNNGKVGITCVLLPHDHPGLDIGKRLNPLNQVFMNGTVHIKQSFIPMDWIIGGQKMAGEGWRMLVECLSIGRSISLPAVGTANGLLSTVTTSAYALVREQFKIAIGNFEGVQEGLAQLGGRCYMMNATRQFTVAAVDAGVKPSVASAISKYHLTENGRVSVNWAMDIHAGRAIMVGPNNYLATMYQSVPIAITVEGANIMTRNLMIFGQGAMRCHPYIRTIYESLMDKDGLAEFDQAMFSYIGYFLQNRVRAQFHSLTAGVFAQGYPSKFNGYYKKISRLSSALAYIGDMMLIILNGNLKTKERLSARLGDAMSYLYMACATLKFYKDNGQKSADDIFVKWSIEHCLYEAQTALVHALDNFQPRLIARMMRFVVFPYGLPFEKPNDKLDHQIAEALLSNSQTRQDFKRMIYLPDDFNDVVGRMEVAYQTALGVQPIKAKIFKALKAKQIPKGPMNQVIAKALELSIINQAELEQLHLSSKYNDEVIQVDEFAAYQMGPKNAHPTWQQQKGV